MESDEENDYIVYGTPLPEYEDETVLRKKAARELEVRDEKGRQRFHGAFTGGFSAGYFNTVGTKEGWTPSSFISSRSKVAEHVQQNPEDFMDEEDLGEFGIASRKIHTSYKFKDSDSSLKKRKVNELDSVIPGEAPLKELVRPVRDTIGIEILKKLGWRPGQGIGPRIKKQEIGVKMYGCALPESSLLEDYDPLAQSYTFAPDDVTATIYKPKDNYFGLGYTGLSKQSVLCINADQSNPTSTKSFLKKDKKKLAISGQAFGVGAFEDDDEDIYSKDDMTQYDFSEFDVDRPSSNLETGKSGKTSNGVLEGFCVSTQPSVIKKYYPPPELPSDFLPKFNSLSTKSLNTSSSSKEKLQQYYSMTATDRSFLLGEKKFQSFQLKVQPPSLVENKLSNKQNFEKSEPSLQRTSSTSSFKPFSNDIAKQERYEEFLKLKDSGEIDKFMFPSSMTEWEKQQELEEFFRSSVLFKPLSNALSSKFESRSHLSVEHEVIDAIEKAKLEKSKKSTSTRKKLMGLKNRQTFDWYPSSILCKRFNVPNPYPNSTPSGSSKTQQRSVFDHLMVEKVIKESTNELSDLSSRKTLEKEVPNKENQLEFTEKKPSNDKKVESQKKPLENQKPSIDFFKDIFENSSSSEEEDTAPELPADSSSVVNEPNEMNEQNKKDSNKVPTSPELEIKNISKKSGFGVFANLDLDALNKKTCVKNKEETDISKLNSSDTMQNIQERPSELSRKPNEEILPQNDLYGPELPPNFSEVSDAKSDDIQNKKHKLKKQKHKHHKHKCKKKKKKKSSHRNSGNSSDSEEDIDPIIILEKLKQLKKRI